MRSNELNNYICHYVKKDKTNFALMLTGEWGSGKSYYISNDLIPCLSKEKIKCVVVSLYGIDSIEDLSKAIYVELRLPTFEGKASEFKTTGRVIAKTVVRNVVGVAGINLSISNDDLQKIYDSVELKNALVIIEDFERSGLEFKDILGYINSLVEQDGVKVLIVTNEDEIIKKNKKCSTQDDYLKYLSINGKEKVNKEEEEYPESVKKYLQVKEKTVGDTLLFSCDVKNAIKNIIKRFKNEKIILFFNEEYLGKITFIVNSYAKNNLRTFIYALQKFVDIIDVIGTEYELSFYECLLCSTIIFVTRIKHNEIPSWDARGYMSVQLGSNEYPFMRFAYEYIRWYELDMAEVDATSKEYKEFRLLKSENENNDPDFKILSNFYDDSEENVIIALRNIEKRLENSDSISFSLYNKMAYYFTYLSEIVGFDSGKARQLMVENIKKAKKEKIKIEKNCFDYLYGIEEDKLYEEYHDFVNLLLETIEAESTQTDFSYKPEEIKDFYEKINRETDLYIRNHKFISRYSYRDIIEMLKNSSSRQIHDFRGILFVVYRNANKGDFDEKDIIVFNKLKEGLQAQLQKKNKWDKIQILQIDFLISNISDFVKQLS